MIHMGVCVSEAPLIFYRYSQKEEYGDISADNILKMKWKLL